MRILITIRFRDCYDFVDSAETWMEWRAKIGRREIRLIAGSLDPRNFHLTEKRK